MDQANERAIPARFWWLTRGGAAVAVLLIGVAAAHVALGRWATAKVERERVAWMAAGNDDPRLALTGYPPPLAGPENAAIPMWYAIYALPPLTATQTADWDEVDWSLPLTATSSAAVRSVVAQDRSAVEQFRTAEALPRIDFGYDGVAITGLLPRLNEYRNMANHLSWGAIVAANDGDVTTALEYLYDTAWLGRACLQDGRTLVGSLVSTGIEAVATRRARDALLLKHPGGLSGEAERRAWRAAAPAARKLIALLLDADYDRDLRVRGLGGEFASVYSAPASAAGRGPGGYNVLTAPFMDADLAKLLAREAARARLATETDDYATFRRRITGPTTMTPSQSLAGMTTTLMSDTLDSDVRRCVASHFRIAVDRRVTGVALAVRLYEADHDGALPETLAELVPAYLPFVPIDPMSPDGAPLRWVRDGPVPFVYGVGENGVDESGSGAADPAATAAPTAGDPGGRRDFVLPLRPPPTDGTEGAATRPSAE